jgi:hypothetical protein
MQLLREALDLDGRLLAVSARDPTYSILLTRNGSSEAVWRVTSFRGKEPVAHREYDRLEGGSPIQNALQEFASDDMRPSCEQTPQNATCMTTWRGPGDGSATVS